MDVFTVQCSRRLLKRGDFAKAEQKMFIFIRKDKLKFEISVSFSVRDRKGEVNRMQPFLDFQIYIQNNSAVIDTLSFSNSKRPFLHPYLFTLPKLHYTFFLFSYQQLTFDLFIGRYLNRYLFFGDLFTSIFSKKQEWQHTKAKLYQSNPIFADLVLFCEEG